MASRVSGLMQRSPAQTFFFAFGAGHFLGNHSVLDILRQEGYEVEHALPGEPITEHVPEPEEVTAEPGLGTSDPVTWWPHSWGTRGPGEEEEELPHLLLPDSLSQLEEFGRQKRPRKQQRSHTRPRLFSDLWVRIEASTTPLPNVRITNGYVTVEPPITRQGQLRRPRTHPQEQPPSLATPPAPVDSALPSTSHALSSLVLCLISHMLFTS
ncbi:hypothetical protein COCON_G00059980 [Conger conger]|uniref:Metalloprotease TIKI n=2 Tax=Conger conger TaxID=82655 RepID=A0A9Q1DR45_CONCO|nr:hypothetical protein COCON_G00059980 [Conger conger]